MLLARLLGKDLIHYFTRSHLLVVRFCEPCRCSLASYARTVAPPSTSSGANERHRRRRCCCCCCCCCCSAYIFRSSSNSGLVPRVGFLRYYLHTSVKKIRRHLRRFIGRLSVSAERRSFAPGNSLRAAEAAACGRHGCEREEGR